jgi:hypothetical protein
MTFAVRQIILRANAVYPIAAASWGMCADLIGAFAAIGPQKQLSPRRHTPSSGLSKRTAWR